jgi:hypothetical protein
MKTIKCIRSFCLVLVTISLISLLSSCQKHEKELTFDDVYDVSGITVLNNRIGTSENVAGLASLAKDLNLTVPADLSVSKLDEMCTTLERNLELTDSETDRLLRNDPEALLSVITRFGDLPSAFGDKNMSFSDLVNGPMNQYLLKQKTEPGINYYPEDYYSAVLAYKGYIEKCVIEPLKHIETVVLKSQDQLPEGADFDGFVLIAMNNNWSMWWSYWSYCNTIYKIKHKGGANSFPG